MSSLQKVKVAVIGGGISGLATAVMLSDRYEVHLFESENRLGGHAHTVSVSEADKEVPLDTGFLVFNPETYPHLTAFLKYLDVQTADSDMSLSIHTEQGLEWAGTNLRSIFAQKKNLFRPKFLGMLQDILKFHEQAEENLQLARKNQWSLEELVRHRKVGNAFLSWYLLPMTGAIWSMPLSQALKFPAETFLNFCLNHKLLQVNDRPVWKTIAGGSIQYVQKVQKILQHVYLNTRVTALEKNQDRIDVVSAKGRMTFDRVVLATHAPISREILKSFDTEWADFLAPLKTTANKVVLHQDAGVMPQKKICWSSWNVRGSNTVRDERKITLSYYCNQLQPLDTKRNYFLTLNEEKPLQNQIRSFLYDHPSFDREAIEVQKRLEQFQGKSGVFIAGAWTRYGFHEDGILSAVKVGQKMGCEPPWNSSKT